jgi:hypothetical protein
MWWIFIIGIVIFIIYKISKENKEEVQTHVTNFGGMKEKYNILISYFTMLPSARITKLTRDNVTIATSSMTVYIDYVGGNTEVDLKMIMPVVGKIAKRWKFPNGYPQEKMIQDIENYLDWEKDKFMKIAGNNYEQYLNR